MRRLALFAMGVATACSPAPRATPSATPVAAPARGTGGTGTASPPTRPVLVTIVVDQMAAWIADERWSELPRSGGFARLTREGTRLRDMRYAHAVTDTAPGHSSLYTGASPRTSGIFANERPVTRASTKAPDLPGGPELAADAVSILNDPDTKMVTPIGTNGDGSSTARLKAPTIADLLRTAKPSAYIVSLSLKDRGAIFGGGRKPDASVWYWPSGPAFVTSLAFATSVPAWARRAPLAEAPATWELKDAEWVKAHARTPDAQAGEGDYHGLGTTFPHPILAAKDPAIAFRATPFADRALLAMAEAALADPRAKTEPTLLAISMSANDYIGHTFGPDSWEAWDELFRLDAALGDFFRALDASFGKEGWAAILSADHGVSPMPEVTSEPWCAPAVHDRWGRACGGGRLVPAALERELRSVADVAMGEAGFVLSVVDPYVYLTPKGRDLPPERRRKLDRALTDALIRHREVAEVIDVRTIPSTCPPPDDDSIAALVCRSYVPDAGAGDYYVVPKAGSFFDPTVVVGKGTSHGTPYVYDRSVPLVVRAPGRVLAGVVVDEPVGFGTFARTASALLGIGPPPSAAREREI